MRAPWKIKYLEVLLQKSPNVSELRIGSIERPWGAYDSVGFEKPENYGAELKNFTNVLAGFPYLENLWLPDISTLGFGYDDGCPCGNCYFGPGGREYGRYETRRRVKATELASYVVLAELPQMKILYMGAPWPNITRDGLGRASAFWPWTGRLEEYTYEEWPEKEMYPGEYAASAEDEEYAWNIEYN